jgi:predicted HAD superfamily Cof-like phosphohydrolase
MTNFEKVRLWMEIAGQATPKVPRLVDPSTLILRQRLMREEMLESGELFDSMNAEDLEGIADGLADLLYVVYGTAVSYGLDMDTIFNVIHENNLTKFDECPNKGDFPNCSRACPKCAGKSFVAITDAGGKVMKNPTWQPPDLKPYVGLA